MHSLYEKLLLPTTASEKDIKNSYFNLCNTLNPRADPSNEIKFREINEAYRILKDNRLKDFYDRFGDTWLFLLKDQKNSYYVTRVFDWKMINLLYTALILISINVFLLPFSIHLYNKQRVFVSLPYIFLFLYIGVFIIIVVMIRGIIILHKKRRIYDFKSDILILFLIITYIFFPTLQCLFFTLYYEDTVRSMPIFYLLPYFTLEFIIIAYQFIFKPGTKFDTTLYKLVIRLIISCFLITDIDIESKSFFIFLWSIITSIMCKERKSSTFILFIMIQFLYLGCMDCLSSPSSKSKYLYFVPLYLYILFIIFTAFFNLKKLKPTSIFVDNKLPIFCDEIRNYETV